MVDKQKIAAEAAVVVSELLAQAKLNRGQVLVIGCSSSEIVGQQIGHGSSLEAAEAVFEAIYGIAKEQGIYLAAQCCEHLNRALVVERACAEQYGWDEVCVKPQPHAGGSFATTAYERFSDPVVVESVRAHAGIDIGGTLIGMHLRPVAVPVRVSCPHVGEAAVLCARTRAKLIGGIRAVYPDGTESR